MKTRPVKTGLRALCCGILLADPVVAACQVLQPAAGADAPVLVFVDGSLGGGTGGMRQLQLRVGFTKHHEISAGYTVFQKDAEHLPAGYSPGGLYKGGSLPKQYVRGLGLSYGFAVPLRSDHRGERLRLVLRAGVVAGDHTMPGNFRENRKIFGPSHDYDDLRQRAVGINVQPGLLFTPSNVFGIGAGLFAQYHKGMQTLGVYGSLLLGRVANRIRRESDR